MKVYQIEAEVHTLLKNGSYRVKVKILDPSIAMYINGMIVFAPSEKHEDWTVYTPKVLNARIVEFAGKSVLWEEIKDACIDAVKIELSYGHKDTATNKDEGQTDEEFNKQLMQDFDRVWPTNNTN